MSEAIKPTPGPWTTYLNTMDDVVIRKMNAAGYEECVIARKVHHRDARLITEAGTVHHETGLTPRQLVERVKELEEALLNLYYYVSTNIDSGFPKGVHISGAEFIEARAALSKSLPNTVAETP